jgi:hypothetical protein
LTAGSLGTTIPTSSTGTSEKIIMEKTTEDIVADIRQWSIDRIHHLCEDSMVEKLKLRNYMDAVSISEEFSEWIDLTGDSNEQLDIMYLEYKQI